MALPEAVAHDQLEGELVPILAAAGYSTITNTYHNVLTPEEVDQLRRVYTPTALLVRTRADRLALHPGKKDCFFLEVKSPPATKKLHLEALPVLSHVHEHLMFGAECMYVYRGPMSGGRIVGEYIEDLLPQVTTLTLTPRAKNLPNCFDNLPPHISIVRREKVFGSGDPFFSIPAEYVGRWKPLSQLLEERGGREEV